MLRKSEERCFSFFEGTSVEDISWQILSSKRMEALQSKYHGPPRIFFVQPDCMCVGTIAAQFSALDGSASPFYDASNGRSCGTFL